MNLSYFCWLLPLCLTVLSTPAHAEESATRPKLVLGIVVDQMRYDYLTRFGAEFGDDGFRRLQRAGTTFHAMHYNYVPTSTGPGHAAVWSGAYPAVSGISNNDFYDRRLGKMVYCVEDATVTGVGTDLEEGRRSPHRLLVTTVGDELKLLTNQRSLVIGVSLKDRSAVLPAGHLADGAYWLDYDAGRFVSSSFYGAALPSWVEHYNARARAVALLSRPWTLRDAPETYVNSRADDSAFEHAFVGESAPVFPHDIPNLAARNAGKEGAFKILTISPGGNTLVREMAEAALRETALGRDDVPDILAVSFSSTDYVGHRFGPASREVEDTYRRLDDELAQLFRTLDETVGWENTLVFLTADHAVSYNSAYLRSLGIGSAFTMNEKKLRTDIERVVAQHYGPGAWVVEFFKGQVFLDRALIREAGLKLEEVQAWVRDYLLELEVVADAVTATDLNRAGAEDGFRVLMRHGAHPTRSGDVFVRFTSGTVFGYDNGGSSHGEAYTYDTHVPFLISGPGLRSGAHYYERAVITQIAPTISAALQIAAPSGAFEGPLPIFEQ
jgi:predicted AlkP superfamily pyrophosphatase or phosphodiesterase